MLNLLKSLWQKVVPSENPVTNQDTDKQYKDSYTHLDPSDSSKNKVSNVPLHYDPLKKDYVPDVDSSLEDFDAVVIDTPKIPVTDAYPSDQTQTVTDHTNPVATDTVKHVDTSATIRETSVAHKHNNNHHFHDANEKKHKLRPTWADDNKE